MNLYQVLYNDESGYDKSLIVRADSPVRVLEIWGEYFWSDAGTEEIAEMFIPGLIDVPSDANDGSTTEDLRILLLTVDMTKEGEIAWHTEECRTVAYAKSL